MRDQKDQMGVPPRTDIQDQPFTAQLTMGQGQHHAVIGRFELQGHLAHAGPDVAHSPGGRGFDELAKRPRFG
jgi:hypothetical protein